MNSVGVARGYLKRPELNAVKFFQFRGQPAYKTGDLVKHLDGNYVYMGRVDRQVKINGVRIELLEVESALQQQPGIFTFLTN